MQSRPATDADLVDVLGRLCAAHREELRVAGYDSPEALALLRDFMRSGPADAGLIDGRPECIFGVNVVEGRAWAWFIATDDLFKQGISAIRFGKAYMQRAADTYGPLWARTSSSGQIVMKWLKAFGFQPLRLGRFNTYVRNP